MDDFMEKIITHEPILKNAHILSENYIPERIFGRDSQLKEILMGLRYTLQEGSKAPSYMLLYGPPGTGKTVSVKFVLKRISELAEKTGKKFNWFYVSCRSRVESKLLGDLLRLLGCSEEELKRFRGAPLGEYYDDVRSRIAKLSSSVVIVFDEIDFVKDPNDLLYFFTRSEFGESVVSLICITNRESFVNTLESRVASSFVPLRVYFPPYSVEELEVILKDRAGKALDVSRLEAGVVELCAAIAGREKGDARYAIALLREAVRIADFKMRLSVTVEDVYEAKNVVEATDLNRFVGSLPRHSQLVLYALAILENHFFASGKNGKREFSITTPILYEAYSVLCRHIGCEPLTSRRVSDLLNDLEVQGVIAISTTSLGRYGRRRYIGLLTDPEKILNCEIDLKKDLNLEEVVRTLKSGKTRFLKTCTPGLWDKITSPP